MNRLSSRLAARSGTRNLDLLAQADAASDAVDREIVRRWNALLKLLTTPGMAFVYRRQLARTHLHGILLAAQHSLHSSLTGLIKHGHDSAADVLVKTLPREVLSAARPQKPFLALLRLEARGHPGLPGAGQFLEDTPRDTRPGAVQFGIQRGRFSSRDRAKPVREPAFRQLTPAQQQEQFRALLFPPPSAEQVQAILHQPIAGRSWIQDLSRASTIAGFDPARMAGLIATGFALGKAPREIAKDLLPVVGNVKSSARRIARTYGMQVVHGVTRAAHEQLGEMLIGYQIVAQLDHNTRSWHASRSGTIYYKTPGPGQKGLDQMPNPPLEASDPRERPAGTPATAFN